MQIDFKSDCVVVDIGKSVGSLGRGSRGRTAQEFVERFQNSAAVGEEALDEYNS